MQPNQQESFYFRNSQTKQGRYGSGVMHTDRAISPSGAAILWLLRKTAMLVEKLIVLAKYQFYKHTAVAPSAVKLPVAKLGVVGGLAFLALKPDLNFSLGMGDGQRAQFSNAAVAEQMSLRENEGESGSIWEALMGKSKVDHFADAPGDTERDRRIKSYVRRFKDTAISEKERFGIPASVKMAQAIVESGAGKSTLSTKSNNHFGIKCFSRTCKKGHCTNFGDDSHKDFFKNYDNAWKSWRAHSEMIVGGRYKVLLKHGDDYRKWARGLKKLGYATAPHYEQTLVEMIEKYHLDSLDD